MNKKLVLGGLIVGSVLVAGSAAIAVAASGDEQSLTGTDLQRATEAALAHTGGGTVIESEVGDGGAAYEVEVRLDDGSVVEVTLDESFTVMNQARDDDGAEGSGKEEGSADDDGSGDEG
jgi:hypothetical protein